MLHYIHTYVSICHGSNICIFSFETRVDTTWKRKFIMKMSHENRNMQGDIYDNHFFIVQTAYMYIIVKHE